VNVNSLDFSSLIAAALSSNQYINALARINYMEMESKLKPYTGEFP